MTKTDVQDVFDSLFQDKVEILDSLFNQWFKMALMKVSIELYKVTYNAQSDKIEYKNECSNEVDEDLTLLIGYIIKRFYCEREYNKTIKRVNVIGKDVTLNATDSAKQRAKEELDNLDFIIADLCNKLKESAYN